MNQVTPIYTATKLAASPGAEITGQFFLALANSIRFHDLEPVLVKFGMTPDKIDPARWYPQQLALDILKSICENCNMPSEKLVSIGMKIMDSVKFPSDITSVEDAVRRLSQIYEMNNRNVPAEQSWNLDFVRPGHLHAMPDVPFPDDLLYGYLWSILRRFRPEGHEFIVRLHRTDPSAYSTGWFELRWGPPGTLSS